MFLTKEHNKSLKVGLNDNIDKLFLKKQLQQHYNYNNNNNKIKNNIRKAKQSSVQGGIWIHEWEIKFGGRKMIQVYGYNDYVVLYT